jgi:uncharacterized protein (DUF433 family)
MSKYIISDPNILNGKPVIVGTRIPISQILFLLKEGYTVQGIHEEYPNVSITKLKGVLLDLSQSLENSKYGSQVL